MTAWSIDYDRFDPAQLRFRETLFTLSNAYMGVRGIEDELPEGSTPGCFIAGMFDRSECIVPEIVAFPEFLRLAVEVDGEVVSPVTCAWKARVFSASPTCIAGVFP